MTKRFKEVNIVRYCNEHGLDFGFEVGTLAEFVEYYVEDGKVVVNVLDFDGTFPIGTSGLVIDESSIEFYGEDFKTTFPDYANEQEEKKKKYIEERRSRKIGSRSLISDEDECTWGNYEIICPHSDCHAVYDISDIVDFEEAIGREYFCNEKITCPCCEKPFYVNSTDGNYRNSIKKF